MDSLRPNYTVFLTKGTHVVSEHAALQIVQALRENATDVTINVDAFGDGSRHIEMTIFLKHVVSMMRHEPEEQGPLHNVRLIPLG